MSYQALYRKWRPKRFSDVIGQEHIITILQNQVKSERISHAYLFCGARGTGKTSVAKILARAVNCENAAEGEPCNACKTCMQNEAMDIIEIDAASNNGVDEIRDLREKVRLLPVLGKFKVYIIDEVHMLSAGAFNALLKTLEEPPAHVVFILATTEPHKLPATVLSRCQRFDFWRLSVKDMEAKLKEVALEAGAEIDDAGLHEIARVADGGMRDALSILEQCVSLSDGRITQEDVLLLLGGVDRGALFTLAGHLIHARTASALLALSDMLVKGKDISSITKDLILYFRNLLVCASCQDAKSILLLSDEEFERLKEQSLEASPEKLARSIDALSMAESGMRASTQPRIILESALVRLCMAPRGDEYAALSERIAALETTRPDRQEPIQPAAIENAGEQIDKTQKVEPTERQLPPPEKRSNLEKHDPAKQDSDAKGCFNALLDHLIKTDKVLYYLLKDGTPVKLEGRVLQIACDENSGVVAQLLRRPERRESLAKALSAATGKDITAEIFVQKKQQESENEDTALIQQAIEFFGEDNVQIK
ncbi:MAG: DNA polymerase III subunit gamma/tau [Bacillota bacterium]|nr:DNA polymerase III subunit gamma/tau [Bacillota bacterium]